MAGSKKLVEEKKEVVEKEEGEEGDEGDQGEEDLRRKKHPLQKGGTKKKTGSKSKAKKKKKSDYRYFKLINDENTKSYGRYTGETPKQAASKGYTKLLQALRKNGVKIPKTTVIYLRESTRNSSRKVYGYTASRQKLKNPQELVIKDKLTGEEKVITYQYRNSIKRAPVPTNLVEMMGGAKKKGSKKSGSKSSEKLKSSGKSKSSTKKTSTKKSSTKKSSTKKSSTKSSSKSSKH